jgi:hypothetical protein
VVDCNIGLHALSAFWLISDAASHPAEGWPRKCIIIIFFRALQISIAMAGHQAPHRIPMVLPVFLAVQIANDQGFGSALFRTSPYPNSPTVKLSEKPPRGVWFQSDGQIESKRREYAI